MGNCPTIGYTLLALSTKWMSSPSKKWRRGISMRYHFIVLYLVWIKWIRWKKQLTPLVEAFSSDGVAFRIRSNINNGALLQKQPMNLTRWLCPQKRPDSKCRSDCWCCKLDVWEDCRCMNFAVVDWCIR